MRKAKDQSSLRIKRVSPEPSISSALENHCTRKNEIVAGWLQPTSAEITFEKHLLSSSMF